MNLICNLRKLADMAMLCTNILDVTEFFGTILYKKIDVNNVGKISKDQFIK